MTATSEIDWPDEKPKRLSPRALMATAVLGFSAATPWFCAAVFLVDRGVGTDTSGALACAAIGTLLALPSLAALTLARYPTDPDAIRTRFPGIVLRAAAFLISLFTLACSCSVGWNLACWLGQSQFSLSTGWIRPIDPPGSMGETLVLGAVSHLIGLFLLWFAWLRRD